MKGREKETQTETHKKREKGRHRVKGGGTERRKINSVRKTSRQTNRCVRSRRLERRKLGYS